jgi:hypothetical protein
MAGKLGQWSRYVRLRCVQPARKVAAVRTLLVNAWSFDCSYNKFLKIHAGMPCDDDAKLFVPPNVSADEPTMENESISLHP